MRRPFRRVVAPVSLGRGREAVSNPGERVLMPWDPTHVPRRKACAHRCACFKRFRLYQAGTKTEALCYPAIGYYLPH